MACTTIIDDDFTVEVEEDEEEEEITPIKLEPIFDDEFEEPDIKEEFDIEYNYLSDNYVNLEEIKAEFEDTEIIPEGLDLPEACEDQKPKLEPLPPQPSLIIDSAHKQIKSETKTCTLDRRKTQTEPPSKKLNQVTRPFRKKTDPTKFQKRFYRKRWNTAVSKSKYFKKKFRKYRNSRMWGRNRYLPTYPLNDRLSLGYGGMNRPPVWANESQPTLGYPSPLQIFTILLQAATQLSAQNQNFMSNFRLEMSFMNVFKPF